MKTIAFLLHNNFEQAEYEDVNNQLKDKGYKTLLITTNKDKEVQAMQQDVDKGDTFTADIFVKDANVSDYDAFVLTFWHLAPVFNIVSHSTNNQQLLMRSLPY